MQRGLELDLELKQVGGRDADRGRDQARAPRDVICTQTFPRPILVKVEDESTDHLVADEEVLDHGVAHHGKLKESDVTRHRSE